MDTTVSIGGARAEWNIRSELVLPHSSGVLGFHVPIEDMYDAAQRLAEDADPSGLVGRMIMDTLAYGLPLRRNVSYDTLEHIPAGVACRQVRDCAIRHATESRHILPMLYSLSMGRFFTENAVALIEMAYLWDTLLFTFFDPRTHHGAHYFTSGRVFARSPISRVLVPNRMTPDRMTPDRRLQVRVYNIHDEDGLRQEPQHESYPEKPVSPATPAAPPRKTLRKLRGF